MILTHLLSKSSCMLWWPWNKNICKCTLEKDLYQAFISRCQVQILQKEKVFYSLDVSLHSISPQQTISKFVSRFLDSTHLAETSSNPLKAHYYIASTVTMFLNFVHIVYARKGGNRNSFVNRKNIGVFIWWFKEDSCSKIHGNWIANCSSVTSYRRFLMFFVNMLNYRILIVQEENDIVV